MYLWFNSLANFFKVYNNSVVRNANDAPMGISYIHESKYAANNPYLFWTTLITIRSKEKYTQQIALPWGNGVAHSIAYRVKDDGKWFDWNYLN